MFFVQINIKTFSCFTSKWKQTTLSLSLFKLEISFEHDKEANIAK